jgi:hypothetical protein
MIKPTVGRIVLFYPAPDSDRPRVGNDPHAAIITAVWGDACINLSVFDANGTPYAQTSVLLVQEGEPKPSWAYAEWMPYQIGQAKKHSEPAPDPLLTTGVSGFEPAIIENHVHIHVHA